MSSKMTFNFGEYAFAPAFDFRNSPPSYFSDNLQLTFSGNSFGSNFTFAHTSAIVKLFTPGDQVYDKNLRRYGIVIESCVIDSGLINRVEYTVDYTKQPGQPCDRLKNIQEINLLRINK